MLLELINDGMRHHVEAIINTIKSNVQNYMKDSWVGGTLIVSLFLRPYLRYWGLANGLLECIIVHGDLMELCQNEIGAQNLILVMSHLNMREKAILTNALKGITSFLMQHWIGENVILHLLMNYESEFREDICRIIGQNCDEISSTNRGVENIQKCLRFSSLGCRRMVLAFIVSKAYTLIQGHHGDFLLERLMPWRPSFCHMLMMKFYGDFDSVSRMKSGSRVVERLLAHASLGDRTLIVDELLNNPFLDSLGTDKYGHHVLIKALQTSGQGWQKQRLRNAILSRTPVLMSSHFGRVLLNATQQ